MSIFSAIREQVTAREAAEYYGLKVSRKGMACCPFHEDRHPSLKIDTGFYCFGCGASGSDATAYVAMLFNLSQIDAARRLIADLQLPIEAGFQSPLERKQAQDKWKKREREQRKSLRDKLQFNKWCGEQIDRLRNCVFLAEQIQERFHAVGRPDEEIPEDVAVAASAISRMDYWLDILCCGTSEDRMQFFQMSREYLDETLNSIRKAGVSYLGEQMEQGKSSFLFLPGKKTNLIEGR